MRILTVVGTVVLALAGTAVAAPASARPAPVDVSVGVATSTVLPYRDGVKDKAVLRLRIDRPARIKLFVADASGRVVRKKYYGTRGKGLHLLTWNAKRASGAALPSGRYTVRFRAYKDGYSPVTSRTRSLRIQQQRLEERTTTLAVRGDAYVPAASSGFPTPQPDGSLHLGHGNDPTTDVAAWRLALPARATQVRARFEVTDVAGDTPRPSYGYLLRSGAFDDTTFAEGSFDGRWIATSELREPSAVWPRMVVRPFFNVDVVRVLVDVRYGVLVDA